MIVEAGSIGGVWKKIDFRRLPRPALTREGKSENARRTCALIHACCFFERFSQMASALAFLSRVYGRTTRWRGWPCCFPCCVAFGLVLAVCFHEL